MKSKEKKRMIEALKKKSGLIPYYSTKEPVFIWISDSFYASGPLNNCAFELDS